MPTVEGQGYGLPPATGLYDPRYESEACGVGFVVNIDGKRSHKVRALPAYDFENKCACSIQDTVLE